MSVSSFPDSWRADVLRLSGGGRDARGNPLPETTDLIEGVLIGWRSTADPVDRSEATEDLAMMYDDSGTVWGATDRVEIPAGPWPNGRWQVDGQPKPWPLGTEIPLRRAT